MALCIGKDTERVNRHQLRDSNLMNPKPLTPTHQTLAHLTFVEMIESCLNELGNWEVVHEELGLSKNGNRLFGVMGLRGPQSAGDYEILWAFRNANDMRFSASAGTGSRVFVCDNLSIWTEDLISHKHTLNIMSELRERIQSQVAKVEDQGKELEARYDHLKGWFVETQAEADHILMEAGRRGVCPHQYLPAIDDEWRKPRHKEFGERNAWSLFNAFTQINRDKNVNFEEQIPRTIKLHKLFDEHTNFDYKNIQGDLGLAFAE